MEQHLLGGPPVFFRFYHFADQVDRRFIDLFPLFPFEVVFLLFHILHNVTIGLPIKRRVSTEQDIQDDSGGPYIAAFVVLP
jgi:hypothetical protein